MFLTFLKSQIYHQKILEIEKQSFNSELHYS